MRSYPNFPKQYFSMPIAPIGSSSISGSGSFRIKAPESAAIAPKVVLYFSPFLMAPKPPMDSPPIKVSSRFLDSGNIFLVISTSSLPMNSP